MHFECESGKRKMQFKFTVLILQGRKGKVSEATAWTVEENIVTIASLWRCVMNCMTFMNWT